MPKRKTTGPQRGSPRVAAWVHEIINPLLDALRLEISFLKNGNITWRYRTRSPEYLRAIEGYIAPQAQPIFDDFRRFNSEAKQRFRKRDEILDRLTDAATAAHSALMNNDHFRVATQRCFADFVSTPDYAGGTILQDDITSVAAERVVNSIKTVPAHYADATFWQRYGGTLREFGKGAAFDRLNQARDLLLNTDQELSIWLEDERFRLCDEYDIPAAPSAGWGLRDSNAK